MLESISQFKGQDFKQSIFEILEICIMNQGDQMSDILKNSSTMINNLIYNQDNMAKPLSEFVGIVTQRQGDKFANMIIDDLTYQIKTNSISHDSGFRNVAKFLSKLSKQVPHVLYLNLRPLMDFFNCESYYLRQAQIKIMSNIIQTVLRENQEDIDETKRMNNHRMKLKLLEQLMKRFHDKSSFCRKKVITVFMKLTIENHVPRDMYIQLLDSVIDRIKDQVALVRKWALKLFTQILMIFGIAFKIDRDRGERFLDIAEITENFEVASVELQKTKDKMKEADLVLDKEIKKLREQNPEIDEPEFLGILGDHDEYQALVSFKKNISEEFMRKECEFKHFEEYLSFLKANQKALDILNELLYSKSVQDTIEVIRLF